MIESNTADSSVYLNVIVRCSVCMCECLSVCVCVMDCCGVDCADDRGLLSVIELN